jgi:uncharacterized protein involved in tolerance to divalent cations
LTLISNAAEACVDLFENNKSVFGYINQVEQDFEQQQLKFKEGLK